MFVCTVFIPESPKTRIPHHSRGLPLFRPPFFFGCLHRGSMTMPDTLAVAKSNAAHSVPKHRTKLVGWSFREKKQSWTVSRAFFFSHGFLRVLRCRFTGKNWFHWCVSLTWFHARVNAAKMVKRDQNSWQPDAGNISGEGEMSQNAGMCIQTALCDGSGPRIYITVKRWLTECPQSSWRQWRKLFFFNKQDTWKLGRSDLKIGRNLFEKTSYFTSHESNFLSHFTSQTLKSVIEFAGQPCHEAWHW